ncbi:MAG: division/cell wall cluster transcriptional repressor MraZ [Calditrichia bacterium]
MSGFWGSFKSTLDTKGRINFPAKFRKNLREEDEDTLILVRASETCIAMYPLQSWQDTVAAIKSRLTSDREFAVISRRLMYQASEQRIDKQGRLNLTTNLIDYAGLEGEVLVVGYEQKIELWQPARYEDYVRKTEAEFQRISLDLDI